MATKIRSILKEYGIRPHKHLGQSFLEDESIMHTIVRYADLGKEDIVVEIGAGLGVMTEKIARQAGRVIAVDVDRRMITILRDRLVGYPTIEILEKDILDCDLAAFLDDTCPSKRLRIIGNIPYYISSPILFHLLEQRRYISDVLLLCQKEVADRIVALPGTKEYGIPTAIVSMYTHATRLMSVSPRCFHPSPKVTSSLLRLVVRDQPLVPLQDEKFFSQVVKIAFAQRRKTLFNNLRTFNGFGLHEQELTLLLRGLGIAEKQRGETLSSTDFGRLSNALFEFKQNTAPPD